VSRLVEVNVPVGRSLGVVVVDRGSGGDGVRGAGAELLEKAVVAAGKFI
jgi:hypothetical protein